MKPYAKTKAFEKIYRFRELLRIIDARLRVHYYRLQGGNIHPKCLFGKGVRLDHPWRIWMGPRCVLQSDVWLNVEKTFAELHIGEYTFIGRGVEIDVGCKVQIGKNSLIAPGVFITDHNHGIIKDIPMYMQKTINSEVTIGDDVWIAANAVILPGVKIENGAVVGAGAVVKRDVDRDLIVGGVPARRIGERSNMRY